ncbi:hypothetical protein [Streptomyces lancefieldiae]|uniref:Uncharacterized protein n=1 Tax=Streptomyces lancefieldiae TaxID=3075520 RepID=A0ABU3ASV9_9ACTN|nr:hypothetical protein [Streptomyces sp. DSM 40712]MDT0612677.1 hypothetical protein [Streptomyces sp. DSM 40712]
MAIDIAEVRRLVETNRRRRQRLLERQQEEFDQRVAQENTALQKARQALYDEALVPFRDVFQCLKHVDLTEPTAIERPTVDGEVGIEPRRPRKSAVQATVGVLLGGALLGAVGSPVVGQVAKAGAYRAVRTFGSASTGRAIRKLSGAAARNATEAWFGRAAGGGGRAAGRLVLSKIETTSAGLSRDVIVQCQIQTLAYGHQARARDLERRERRMREKQDAAPALHERGKDMQRVLQELRSELVGRLPSFTALVEACDDFVQYDSRRRAEVAAMVELDGLAVTVMNCPITDAEGRMTEESGRVVADAEARLRAMETET